MWELISSQTFHCHPRHHLLEKSDCKSAKGYVTRTSFGGGPVRGHRDHGDCRENKRRHGTVCMATTKKEKPYEAKLTRVVDYVHAPGRKCKVKEVHYIMVEAQNTRAVMDALERNSWASFR